MDTSVWGNITVRPVRVALAIGSEDLASALEPCIELATASWGGQLYPIIPIKDVGESLEIADFFDVDVMHSADGGRAATEASKATGFQWRWMSTSPFDRSDELVREHVLGMESVLEAYFLQSSELNPVLLTWDDDHPLRLLNGALDRVDR